MNPIGDYLEKFFISHTAQLSIKSTISIVIKNITGINIPESLIGVRNQSIHLNVHPVVLSELFLHKQKLITELKKETSIHYTIVGL